MTDQGTTGGHNARRSRAEHSGGHLCAATQLGYHEKTPDPNRHHVLPARISLISHASSENVRRNVRRRSGNRAVSRDNSFFCWTKTFLFILRLECKCLGVSTGHGESREEQQCVPRVHLLGSRRARSYSRERLGNLLLECARESGGRRSRVRDDLLRELQPAALHGGHRARRHHRSLPPARVPPPPAHRAARGRQRRSAARESETGHQALSPVHRRASGLRPLGRRETSRARHRRRRRLNLSSIFNTLALILSLYVLSYATFSAFQVVGKLFVPTGRPFDVAFALSFVLHKLV